MYLRRLEILGFKSFAQKTALDFPRGVAAIVGPNGCGKSNVLDAIRWALGEQSAKALRGGEMADVIFNGADSRQAVGMAEVTMTFAECEAQLGTDYHEVSISRRVYRDGKGEYLLNKTLCRLRDIQEMFMDTGIGRSAYSIMEQGRIDQIISTRPEDRRAIFEEAAGITKYKSQRREATRKLEHTDANLIRLTDVIGEVKRQLVSLQRQAAKARRHQTLSSELRLLDTHLGHEQFSKLSRDLAATDADLADARAAQAAAENELATGETHLADARAVVEDLSIQWQDARAAAQECRDRLRAAESRKEFNAERARESATLQERYAAELAGAEGRLVAQEEQLLAADAETREIAALLDAGRRRLGEQDALVREARARRVGAETTFQNAGRAFADAERRREQGRGDLTRFIQQQQVGEVRREVLSAEIARLEPARAAVDERLAEARASIVSGQGTLDARRQELRAAEEAVAAANKELAASESTLAAVNKAQTGRTSWLDALRGLNEAGAGFSAGTQAVLKGLDNPELIRPAIIGVLGATIDVPSRFIPAVEAILGHHLQTILLRDAEVADVLLHTLATGKKVGRATLAAPGALPPTPPDSLAGPITDLREGWLKRAREVVKSPATVAPLLDRLLADSVIVETLAYARAVRDAHPEWTVATLGGELLDRDGFLHGGEASGESARQGVLQRQTQIRALEKEIDAGKTEIDTATAARADAAARAQAAAGALADARGQLQTSQIGLAALQSQVVTLERDARDLTGKVAGLRREQTDGEKQFQAAREQTAAIEARVHEAAADCERFGAERATAAEETETVRAQENTLAEALNELRVRVATEQQRHEGLRRQRQPMDDRRAELAELIVRRRAERAEHGRRLERYADESSDLDTAIETARADLADAEKTIAQRRDEHADAASDADTLDAGLRSQRQALAASLDRRSQLEVRAAQWRLRQDHLHEQIAGRYQVDLKGFVPDPSAFLELYRTLAELPGAEIDWPQVETLAGTLRGKLDAIGTVNVDAIAEYDSLEERHTFLDSQHADLVAAKKELLSIIAQINATSRTLFADTFERIRVNFQEMYGELFGGGKANLLLTNEEDPLECGIDIIARPPGKQLQSIMLLSGGEKTMTAVALLFAIYMVKPSPFCVLDEMDAPLDESNISRFLKILDRFVGQSQFVVITHNKRTISRADVLYGVTMEEAGVSKIVAVRLARREQETGVGRDLIGTANASAVEGAVDESATGTATTPLLNDDEHPPSIAESFGKHGDLHSERAINKSVPI